MTKHQMIALLERVKEALSETGLLTGKTMPDGDYTVDDGSKVLIGQLLLASAIEESLNTISNTIRR